MLGLTQYTYIVGRFFPFAFAGAVAASLPHPGRSSSGPGASWPGWPFSAPSSPAAVASLCDRTPNLRRAHGGIGRRLPVRACPIPSRSCSTSPEPVFLCSAGTGTTATNATYGRPWLNRSSRGPGDRGLRRPALAPAWACASSWPAGSLMLATDLIFYEGPTRPPPPGRRRRALFFIAAARAAELSAWLTVEAPRPAVRAQHTLICCRALLRHRGAWDYAPPRPAPGCRGQGRRMAREPRRDRGSRGTSRATRTSRSCSPRPSTNARLSLSCWPGISRAAGVQDVPWRRARRSVLMPARPTGQRPRVSRGLPADEWVLLKDGTAYFLPPCPARRSPRIRPDRGGRPGHGCECCGCRHRLCDDVAGRLGPRRAR